MAETGLTDFAGVAGGGGLAVAVVLGRELIQVFRDRKKGERDGTQDGQASSINAGSIHDIRMDVQRVQDKIDGITHRLSMLEMETEIERRLKDERSKTAAEEIGYAETDR